MKKKFKIEINWTPGEHVEEMREACYHILRRYAKAQRKCCVCGESVTMRRVKKLISLYKKRNKWDDLDLVNLNFMTKHENNVRKSFLTCGQRWMRMVFKVHSSMWC